MEEIVYLLIVCTLEQQLTFFLALAVGLIFGGLAVWLAVRPCVRRLGRVTGGSPVWLAAWLRLGSIQIEPCFEQPWFEWNLRFSSVFSIAFPLLFDETTISNLRIVRNRSKSSVFFFRKYMINSFSCTRIFEGVIFFWKILFVRFCKEKEKALHFPFFISDAAKFTSVKPRTL